MLNLRNHRQCPAGGFSFVAEKCASVQVAPNFATIGELSSRQAVREGALNRSTVESRGGSRRSCSPFCRFVLLLRCGNPLCSSFLQSKKRLSWDHSEGPVFRKTGPEI